MHVPFQITVPMETAVELRDQLNAVTAVFQAQVDKLNMKVRAGGDPAKLLAEQKRLAAIKKRLTIQHLVRVYLRRGMDVLQGVDAAQLLDLVSEDPVALGRPTAEAARGARAA